MKVRFALLADFSNITVEGKINIVGVFDILHAPEFPVRHLEMQLVMRFEADISEPGQHKDIQVRLIHDRGQPILELNGSIVVSHPNPGDFLFFNQVLTLRNVVFPRAGDYQFDIYVDDELKFSVPLKVVGPPADHKS